MKHSFRVYGPTKISFYFYLFILSFILFKIINKGDVKKKKGIIAELSIQ